jgi:para-aminobenzoate synthetase/4-amino-4-deoxychorismate lyase
LIERESQTVEYGIGGGIVWDSIPSEEYSEALLKARVLLKPRPSFSLLETILWTPEEGFFLKEKHLTRMLDSADYFNIPILRERLEEYLTQISSSFYTAQRVRIVLDQAGNLDSESKPFALEANLERLNVCLAKQPIDSSNTFLFHKTTQRDFFEAARKGCEEFDDVLLYNEFGELTEFTIGNLIVEWNGQWLTPPIACGVLPGTFRAHLIETGQVLERTIRVDQLSDCTNIFRVNSIRKWQRVEIQRKPVVLSL